MPRRIQEQIGKAESEIKSLSESLDEISEKLGSSGLNQVVKELSSSFNKIRSVLKDFNKETKKTNANLKNVNTRNFERALDDLINLVEKFNKESTGNLEKALKNLKKDFGQSDKVIVDVIGTLKKLISTSGDASGSLDSFDKTINSISINLRKLPSALSEKQWSNFSRGAKKSETQIKSLKDTVNRLRKDIAEKQEFLIEAKLQKQMGSPIDSRKISKAQKEIGELETKLEGIEDTVYFVSDAFDDMMKSVNVSMARELFDPSDLESISEQVQITTKDWDRFGEVYGKSARQVSNAKVQYERNEEAIKRLGEEILDLSDEIRTNEKLTVDDVKKKKEKIQSLKEEKQSYAEANEETKRYIKYSEDAIETEKRAARETNIFAKALGEGEDEARNFAGGLGGTATGALAAGVAFVYLGTKINEIGRSIEETKQKWAEYNVELVKASEVIPDFAGGVAGLDKLREDLRLSREEASAFNVILKEASVSGVITTQKIIEAGKQIADTFGGDPTEMVREFVDLLKEIPTLETDLAITASVDKQTEAWFALAERGRVQQVIELQTAGLLGGEQGVPEGSQAEVDTLKAIREMNVLQENIEKGIMEFVPSWFSYVTRSAGIGLSLVSGVGSLITYAGAQTTLLGQIASNTAASAVGGFKKPTGGLINKLTGVLTKTVGGKAAGAAAMGTGAGGAGGAVAGTGGVGLLGSVGAGLASFAAGLTATAIAAKPVGEAYKWIAGQMREDGSKFFQGMAWLNENINPVGMALKAFGVTTADANDALGDFLIHVGDWWADAASEVYEYLFVSKKEKDARIKAATEELKKAEELEKTNKELQRMQQSALALEKALGFIKAATESPVTELAKLGQEVAELKLDTLKLAGANASEFNEALDQGVKGLTREFDRMNSAFDRARTMILRDSDLTSEMRRAAILKLNKAELEATKKFIDGMIGMVGRFSDIPEVASAELTSAFKEISLRLTKAGGGDFLGGGFDELEDAVFARAKTVRETSRNLAENAKITMSQTKAIAERTKITGKEFTEELERIKNEAKSTDLGNIAELIKASVDPKSLKLDEEIKILDRGKIEEALRKTKNKIDDIESEASKSIDVGLLETLEKHEKKYESIRKKGEEINDKASLFGTQIGMLQTEIENDLKQLSFDEALKKGTKEFVDYNAELGKLIKSQESAYKSQEKILKIESKLRDVDETSAKKLGEMVTIVAELKTLNVERNKHEEEASKIYEQLTKTREQTIEWAKKNTEIGRQGEQSEEKLLTAAEELLKKTKDTNDQRQQELVALENRKTFLEKIIQKENIAIASQKAATKSAEEVAKQLENYLGVLNQIPEMVEQSGTIQRLKRQLDIASEQRKYLESIGQSEEGYIQEWESEVKLLTAQLNTVNRGKALIKKITSSEGERNKELKILSDELGEMQGLLGKAFEGLDAGDAKKNLEKLYTSIRESFGKFEEAVKSGDETQAKKLGRTILEQKKIFDKSLEEASKKTGGKLDVAPIESGLEQVVNATRIVVDGVGKVSDELEVKGKETRTKLINFADNFDEFLQSLRDTPIQKATEAIMNEAEAMFNLALIMGDGTTASEARLKAEEALAKSQAELTKKYENAEEKAKAVRDVALSVAKTEAERQKAQREFEERMAKISAQRATLEIQRVQKVSEWTQQAVDAQMRLVELKQEELGIQREVLDTVGASVGLIYQNQAQQLAVTQERASILKDAYETAFEKLGQTPEVEEKRLQYIKAAAEVTKQSMELQRDAYDKLMDKAFGAIRSERGARRQLLSEAQMFGTGYVKQAATGLVIPGASQTLQQTALERGIGAGEERKKGLKPEEKQLSAANKQMEAAQQFLMGTDEFRGILSEYGTAVRHVAEKMLGNFARGGYTGDGSKKETAGVVHKGEYVVKADQAKKYRGLLERINKGEDIKGYRRGGMVDVDPRWTKEEAKRARDRMYEEMTTSDWAKEMARAEYNFQKMLSEKAENRQKALDRMREEMADSPYQKAIDEAKGKFRSYQGSRGVAPRRQPRRIETVTGRGRMSAVREAAVREQPTMAPPVTPTGRTDRGASSQDVSVNVKANVQLSLDTQGNLKAMITKIVQEQVPNLIRSDHNTQNAINTVAPTKKGT